MTEIKRFRSSYTEKDFTAEVMRWLTPAREIHRDKLTGEKTPGEGRYDGPGWLAHRIVDQPWIPDVTRVQQKKPFDAWFAAPVTVGGGRLMAEFHALELKLEHNSVSLPFRQIAGHQWDALHLTDRQGLNAFGWVLLQFRLDKRATRQVIERLGQLRAVFAVRARHLEGLRKAGQRSVTVEQLREPQPWLGRPLGIELELELVNPWRSTKASRYGWNLTPLLRGGRQTQTQSMKETA